VLNSSQMEVGAGDTAATHTKNQNRV